jgi:maltooligosyltrehalose trehalohydrolase
MEYVDRKGAALNEPLLGARPHVDGVRFGLFADRAAECAVRVFDAGGAPAGDRDMRAVSDGFFEASLAGAAPGTLYKFVVDGRELADPFARYLPMGVEGPAEVIDEAFSWKNGPGLFRPLCELVFYELHVGTFTEQGTYAGARARLGYLAELGVTAIELMPLAAFPGRRGWGYDGVALYAPYAPYGRPEELRAFVDHAHGLGLCVFLDVVYNHMGPSGNHLPAYCPRYLSAHDENAWGRTLDYAHPVLRRAIVENARYWLESFRFDGLRLDAVHAIIDRSSPHVVREITTAAARMRPQKLIIAEDDRNDARLVTNDRIDAIWADDFHHQVRVTLTGEHDGYYAAYRPNVADLARTINRGWLYEGQTYPVTGKPRGTPADGLPPHAFVYCLQNHDQVGNRAFGDRLNAVVSPERYRAVSMLLLFLPMTPLLFMGQEWAASSPFLFFTDHEPELGRLISEGRRREFERFSDFCDPAARTAIPDPQAASSFEASRLRWGERDGAEHAKTLELYRRLLHLRSTDPVLRRTGRSGSLAETLGDVLMVRRNADANTRTLVLNLSAEPFSVAGLSPGSRPSTTMLRSDLAADAGDVLPAGTATILAS